MAYIAYAQDDMFESFDSKEDAHAECADYVERNGEDAKQAYVLWVDGSDLVQESWAHDVDGSLDESEDYVGEDVDMLS